MPISTAKIATCHECGTETHVMDTYWPATRWEPADGEMSPEECPKCGTPFDFENTTWVDDEPPEPSYDDMPDYGDMEVW